MRTLRRLYGQTPEKVAENEKETILWNMITHTNLEKLRSIRRIML